MSNRRIKLLIIKDCFPLGGTETLILKYLELLDRSRFDVHFVVQTADMGDLMPSAQERSDHFRCLNRKSPLDISAIIQLRKYLIDNSIDIVHVNGWLDSLYVWFAAKRLKLKKIVTVHGHFRSWRNYVYLEAIKSFDRIIAVSRSLKLELFNMGLPYEKLITAYNCYDDKLFKKRIVKPGLNNNGRLNIVMVGNFQWIKDQKTIIEAVHILKQEGCLVKLHLVGGDSDLELFNACQRLVSDLGITDSVVFTGQKRVDGRFLASFDLFVFSSLGDTFGIALLEAMACGLPVLVSDIPPLMELIEHGKYGLYFEVGNARSCADGIFQFIKDQALQKTMGEKAYLRAQDFRPGKIVRDLTMIYLDTMRLGLK